MTKVSEVKINVQNRIYKTPYGIEYNYQHAHYWIKKYFGRATKCENKACAKKSLYFEWSNISHEYRLDKNDWRQLCKSCHRSVDCSEYQRILASRRWKGQTHTCKPVNMFDISGNFIKEYPSLMSAAQDVGILRTSISNAIRGQVKTSGGFIWRRKGALLLP